MSLRHALSQLKWYDYAVVGLGLAFVLYLQEQAAPVPQVSDHEIVTYGPETTLDVADGFSPGNDARLRQAFDAWSERSDYFGAFAVGRGGVYGWSTQYNSLAAARRTAISFCEENGSGCEVVAIARPLDAREETGFTLSALSAGKYNEYRRAGEAKALAASAHGYLEWVADQRSRDEAIRGALAKCEAEQASYGRSLPFRITPCRVLRAAGSED